MSTYFQILTLIFVIPFIISFHPKINFYKNLQQKVYGLVCVLAFFVVWDVWFTGMGVWEFSKLHVSKSSFYGLPLEEVLFFPVVAFSMLVVFYSLKHIYKDSEFQIRKENFYTASSILFLVGVWNYELTYTFVVCLLTSIAIFWATYFRLEKIQTKAFLYTLLISFLPFLIFNQMLTGTPVVLYDTAYNLGIRVGSIPIEDFVYNFLLIFLILVV